MEDGAFCGVFDGHGKNGHPVSKLVRNKLPSLLLNQKNALTKINKERVDGETMVPNKTFHKWKEACISAFKAMDKEIKLLESLDCSCSGTTAVVVIRQCGSRTNKEEQWYWVWDVLRSKEVAYIVSSADSEQAAARAVVNAAIYAWKHMFPSSKIDDCTVLCLFLHKRQQPPPPPLHLMA
ncbi:unnamed protein product [Camellia sinensis]